MSNRNGNQSTIDLSLWDGQDLWSTIIQIYTTISQTDLHAFLQRTSYEKVIKNQSILNFPLVMILFNLKQVAQARNMSIGEHYIERKPLT